MEISKGQPVLVGLFYWRERMSNKFEMLHNVPLDLCDDNAFEKPERPIDCDVDSYVNSGERMSHPFTARRKSGGHFEILGANEILSAAREQGIKQLGTLIVEDIPDEMWLLRSYYTRCPLNITQSYYLYCKSLEMGVDLEWKPQQLKVLRLMHMLRNECAYTLPYPLTDEVFLVDGGELRWVVAEKVVKDIMRRAMLWS
jgi:hypothetical protein